jgi:hypothetical protein
VASTAAVKAALAADADAAYDRLVIIRWRPWPLLCAGCMAAGRVCAQDIDYAGADDAQGRSFNHEITGMLRRHAPLLDGYLALNALPVAIDLTVHRNENQLAAMIDTFVGRYDDAVARMRANSLDSAGEVPVECPASPWRREDAVDWLATGVADARVLLVNEAHNLPVTRALLYRMLPVLRARGFDTLAMETLRPTKHAGELADTALVRRGYPLDGIDTGMYVREPIDGELVRSALSLGFRLVAYDSDDSGDARELAQATHLAAVLSARPGARMVVIAGYAHITRDWMAGHLRPMVAGKVVAVDQIDALGGCIGQRASRAADANRPFVYVQANGQAWAMRPQAYEISVVTPPRASANDTRPRWPDLGKARKRFPLRRGICAGHDPCLVEARYANEGDMAVPADRYLFKRTDMRPALYLRPGDYRLRVTGAEGRVLADTRIAVTP